MWGVWPVSEAHLTVVEADTPERLGAVRKLCWDYRDFLLTLDPKTVDIALSYYPEDGYRALLDALPQGHTSVKLARLGEVPVGCGMSQAWGDDAIEFKRIFVTEAARGHGAGRAIVEALIDAARADGYTRVLFDTDKPLHAAHRLYRAMGFQERGPYEPLSPELEAHLIFFEMDLRS